MNIKDVPADSEISRPKGQGVCHPAVLRARLRISDNFIQLHSRRGARRSKARQRFNRCICYRPAPRAGRF